jgi:uncharacterized protein YwgA
LSNIKENIAIQIYNYNPFVLSVNTNITSHILQPCYDYGAPTSDYVTFAELSYVNSNSTAIRGGLIRFDKEQEKDIYEALQIRDYENILSNSVIEDIILNPNKEKLQKLVDIMDSSIFDRVVAIYQGLINSGEYDVSNRVTNIIDIRKSEFRKGITSSQIQLKAKDDSIQSTNEDLESVKAQNDALQTQLNQMQEMMAELLASQNKADEPKINEPVKKAGRPKKTTE